MMRGLRRTICILAGGLGQRLGERTARTPKPLLDVAGEPFVFHQLRLLAEHGAERVVLCVGYLGEMIEERVGEVAVRHRDRLQLRLPAAGRHARSDSPCASAAQETASLSFTEIHICDSITGRRSRAGSRAMRQR